MRLGAVLLYELRHQARRPTIWLYALGLLALVGTIIWNELKAARTDGTTFDAPIELASAMLLASLAGLLTAAALAADTATRDATTRLEPLLLVTPLRRHEYLGGRFLAAFAVYGFLLLLVPLAYLLVVRTLAAPELVSPFDPMTYVRPLLFVGLPNAFITTALLFAVAALSRRAVASYLAAAVVLVGTMLSFQASVTLLARWQFAALADPLAFAALMRTAQGWTLAQRNVTQLGLEGELLANRVVWVTVACAVLGLTMWRWGAGGTGAGGRAARSRTAPAAVARGVVGPPAPIPAVTRRFDFHTGVRQTLAIARRSFLDVATSWGALLIAGVALFHVALGPELMEHLGVPLYPTTSAVVRLLTASAATGVTILASLLTIFYAGELVWRERDLRLAPLTGAAPIPGWAVLLGKFLGLALVLAVLQLLLVAAGVVTQAALGYTAFEPAVYLQTMLGLRMLELLLFATLAVVLQVIAGNKYVGWLAGALVWAMIAFPNVGIEHRMLVYTRTPEWTYEGMRGFGATLSPVLWFDAWWAAWAVLLAIIARLLLVRGIDLPLRERLRRARRRFGRGMALGTLTTAGAICGLGGFIFWNTNVLHDYRTEAERIERRAEYERRYGAYEGGAQPVLAATSLRVELYPSERKATVRGRYVLRNDTGVPIDTIHLAPAAEVETGDVTFGRPAHAALVDDDLGHRIYVLATPLLPGDSLPLEFDLRYAPRGFTNDGAAGAVVANGTYLELDEWLPGIGYQPQRELSEVAQRETHRLPPRPVPGPADAAAETAKSGRERSRFEIVLGTDAGQTAAAPGVLLRSWTGNGRAYFAYAAPVPISRRRAIFSAEYAVHRSEWQGIPIEVLYDPAHAWNVDRMVRAAATSLAHFTRTIGPYPFGVVRIVERPDAASGATAFPGLVAYSEPLALMRPEADARGIDFQFAVMAHEMAHQWWGNQLLPAPVTGGGLLTESLAWYSAFSVVEAAYGRAHLEGLLELMHEAYLQPMPRAHPPVLYAVGGFLGYRKGAFAMHAAREYLGDERVTAVLRGMFDAHADGRLPHPTSLDLYAGLRAAAPDSLRPLLHDVFEANVWWDLAVRRATAEQLPSGEWDVTVTVRAGKVMVDTLGTETALPLDELVEIGLYREDFTAEPLYLRPHRIREREQAITVRLSELPAHAAVNPRHLLVDDVADGDWRPVVAVEPSVPR